MNKYHAMMAMAGPTKTNGCKRRVHCAGSCSTNQFAMMYKMATPPTPVMMATSAITACGASLSRMKMNARHIAKNVTTGTNSATRTRLMFAASHCGKDFE